MSSVIRVRQDACPTHPGSAASQKGNRKVNKDYPELARTYGRAIRNLRHELPETLAGFSTLHNGALEADALSTKTKELIAVALGISSRCEGCIALHVKAALNAGANRREIAETVGVAVLMGGGPSLLYGTEAMSALEQFEAKQQPVGAR